VISFHAAVNFRGSYLRLMRFRKLTYLIIMRHVSPVFVAGLLDFCGREGPFCSA
jgi:hypothetical protein